MCEDAVMAEHFRQAEVNFLLSGLDSSGNEHSTKARMIADEITIDDTIR